MDEANSVPQFPETNWNGRVAAPDSLDELSME